MLFRRGSRQLYHVFSSNFITTSLNHFAGDLILLPEKLVEVSDETDWKY